VGNGEPQAFATFLALGEFTSFLRLGSFKYWQRQGLCSFSLLQQTDEGGLEEVMALAHALSCNALHVTAVTHNSVSARATKVTMMHSVAYETFIFEYRPRRRRYDPKGVVLITIYSGKGEWHGT